MNKDSYNQASKSTITHSDKVSFADLLFKIQEWYKFILSRWHFLLIAALIGVILGLAYSSYKKHIYTATTTFVLEESDKSAGGLLGQYAGLASMVGFDIGGGGGGIFQGDNILELYKSYTMVEKTLLTPVEYQGKPKLLIDRYIEFNNLREKWTKPELKNISFSKRSGQEFSRTQDSILSEIAEEINEKNLIVTKPDKKLSIIEVEVHSTDESFSKSFNDEIVKNVNDFYVQTKTKKSLQNVAILQQQTDSVKNVLNGAIYQAVAITDITANLNPTRQKLRVPAQRSQFNAEANKAILTELVKNLELSKIALRKETPLIQVIDKPKFPLKEKKVSKAMGILIGGMLGVFVTICFLLTRYIIKGIMHRQLQLN